MLNRILPALCLLCSFMPLSAQSGVQRLQDIKRVYVGFFGDGDGADLVRNKIIGHLVKSKRIEVVENEDQADAILTGAAQVTKSKYYSATATTTSASANGGTKYHATAGVRLLSQDSRILWADDTSNGLLARSASSSLADKISKKLLKAIDEDGKRK